MGTLIFCIIALVFGFVDYKLYAITVMKHGAQFKTWPGSGFYVWWKHRNTNA